MFESPVKGKNHQNSFITSLSPTSEAFPADCAGITPCATPPQHCQQEKTVILVTKIKKGEKKSEPRATRRAPKLLTVGIR